LAAGARSALVEIDVYRDFEDEGDETVVVRLGAIGAGARGGTPSSVSLAIVDGEPWTVDKNAPDDADGDVALVLPVYRRIAEDAVEFGVAVANPGPGTTRLVAEWSTDPNFETDVHALGEVGIPPVDPDATVFPETHPFSLAMDDLAPDGTYHVRAHLPDAEVEFPEPPPEYAFGFATDADGTVVVRCAAPARSAGAAATDPLYREQWHLDNTGQAAGAAIGGVPGADLRMGGSIDAGRGGRGVRLAIVDSGMEICHPDLAANAEPGKSYNFGHADVFGASPVDPFNIAVFGDHGTSVAGIAGAASGNGLGIRGVAPEVGLRAFALPEAGDWELVLLKSLGASGRAPDSAGVDVFNLSFGIETPSENASGDLALVLETGTRELRDGRGAVYVKAAGNEFDACDPLHALNLEIGCIGANADPLHNLPYVIPVGGFNASDVKSSYSSAGANVWVVAPAGEDGERFPAIVTTDQAGVDAGFPSYPGDTLGPGTNATSTATTLASSAARRRRLPRPPGPSPSCSA